MLLCNLKFVVKVLYNTVLYTYTYQTKGGHLLPCDLSVCKCFNFESGGFVIKRGQACCFYYAALSGHRHTSGWSFLLVYSHHVVNTFGINNI